MIREKIPIVGGQNGGGERVLTMYRMWHCFDCGLQFSMLTREEPQICPRCCRASKLQGIEY
jgi:rubrerythrin